MIDSSIMCSGIHPMLEEGIPKDMFLGPGQPKVAEGTKFRYIDTKLLQDTRLKPTYVRKPLFPRVVNSSSSK